MPVVNDVQVKPDHPLEDGDRVELLVSIQGG
jgi:sulfur carrier protein ThiS